MSEYEWPRVAVVHPEHGSYQLDVHCLRAPTGAMVLVVFHGVPSQEQVRIVGDLAAGTGDTIEPLTEGDISEDMSISLAAHFFANPDSKVGVVQVERPGGGE